MWTLWIASGWRRHGCDDATFLNNEKALKRFCEEQDIPVKRGLKLMIELVEHDKIDAEVVIGVALKIQENKLLFINDAVIEDFKAKVAEVNPN